MTTKQLLKQLKDKNPETRKAAIKALARAKDRAALVPLAKMSGDDRDREVREMALKAGQYILQQTGGLKKNGSPRPGMTGMLADPTAPPPLRVDEKGRPVKVLVTEEDARRAQEYVDAALTAQMAGDLGKAMKLLARALVLNPNLRSEPYFTSTAEAATGEEGEDAIQMLFDKTVQTRITRIETETRKRKEVEEHLSEAKKLTWMDVAFDLMMFAVVVTVTVIVVGLLGARAAQSYVDSVEKNRQDVIEAVLAGRVESDPKRPGEVRYYYAERTDINTLIYFRAMDPDENFLAMAQDIAALKFSRVLLAGFGLGIGAAALLLLLNAITHGASAWILKGAGTFRYLTHRVVSMFVNRSIVLGALAGVGSLAIFGLGGGIIITIVGGVMGLVALTIILKMVAEVGQAYHFGFARALMATGMGGAVVAAIAGLGGMMAL